MIKQAYSFLKVSKPVWIFFFSLVLSSPAMANSIADTAKKQLLAAAKKKDKSTAITLERNVVFPDILSGNELESLSYIEKFSVNRRAYIIRTYNRSKKYFPKTIAILKKYDLPQELKILLALESAFNANAVSKAGAVGYWQIMDEVAKEYGLRYVAKQNTSLKIIKKEKKNDKKAIALKKAAQKPAQFRDDRKNFNKSTYAAARYLRDRSKNLDNNLLLMVASYNCGVGNVWEAMRKTGKREPDFWDIKAYLPAETRSYVMNFITLNVIFHNYDNFTNNKLQFTPVRVKVENTEADNSDELTSKGTMN
jgi:soluble lytic murein transglycosylase-like protein